MLRVAAARSLPHTPDDAHDTVRTPNSLLRAGWTVGGIRGQLQARRWQRVGRAIVQHNGRLHEDEERVAALLNCGPRAVLTAFTAAAEHGLTGWERPWIDVLVPSGARVCRPPGLAIRVHYTGDWNSIDAGPVRRRHALAPSLVRAAGTFARPRPACGLLAAAVQQRLVQPNRLLEALGRATRGRHRAALVAATQDITQGAQALSEIDFARLCRRNGLPEPVRQAVRMQADGRRRYLDVEWIRRRDRQRVVAEVDGALHLIARRWWDDQLRQNELVIAGDLILRFPTVVVRSEAALVADQLRRALR